MTYFKGHESALEFVSKWLQPPDPLAHQPDAGNDKLNMYVQGLHLITIYSPFRVSLPEW